MRKLTALLLPLLLWISPIRGQTETSRQLFTQIDPILQGLSDITGWKVKHKVPADYISRAKLAEFIQRRVREVVKPEDIRIEALSLKMFGFLPEDYDLKQAMVELMTEQAAAFYDYDRKRLFITESETSFLEKRAALVHELAHALADQNFPLGRFIRKGNKSDDSATAREAVMEGQATWLMWAYVSKLGGGDAKVSDIILDSMKGSATTAVGSEYPVFEKAPLYLRESLIFPYGDGLQFQNAVVEKLGKAAFAEVFRRPPVSSRQILHPDQYLAKKEPSYPEAPKPPNPKRYREVAVGSVGELDFRILLDQYASKEAAQRVPPHWRGGQFRLFEAKRDRRPVLTFVAEWETPEAAREFFELYRGVLRKKWKRFEAGVETDRKCTGTGDRGGFVLTLDDARVSSVEGLEEVKVN